jgi:hypothetical protein
MPIDVAKAIYLLNSVVIVDGYEDMTYADFRTIVKVR